MMRAACFRALSGQRLWQAMISPRPSQVFEGFLSGRAQRAGLRVEDLVLCQPNSGEMALFIVLS